MKNQGIVIIDFGSQYTFLIARRLREIGVYTEIVGPLIEDLSSNPNVKGVILAGGPQSVTDADAKQIPAWIQKLPAPVLGICYGMQGLVQQDGGKVVSKSNAAESAKQKREYGKETMVIQAVENLLADIPQKSTVWMSHGDHCETLPTGWKSLAESSTGVCVAAQKENRFGIQFHPEVVHTEHGTRILKNFAIPICELKADWQSTSIIAKAQQQIRGCVQEGNVLMACSGGVDSTVAALLLAKTIGAERVRAVLVDHGLLRQNEAAWVKKELAGAGFDGLEVLQEQERFLAALAGVTDPEEKRKIIGRTFIEVFENYAKRFPDIKHLGQGTLYPDVIESAGAGFGAHKIKSHHNVGGLPEKMQLKLVEPFRDLFKDEVRMVGKELGLSEKLLMRHPFPGPGLGIRVLGEVTAEKCDILRRVDDIYMTGLQDHGLYHQTWQAYAGLLPVKTVGVMGDGRSYLDTVVLRAVDAQDGMTASASELPHSFLQEISNKIIREVAEVGRVFYDCTGKPPGTIELE